MGKYIIFKPTQEQISTSLEGVSATTSFDGNYKLLTPLDRWDPIWEGDYVYYEDNDMIFPETDYRFKTYEEGESSDIYKIYQYVTPETKENIQDYTIPPHGIDYKRQLIPTLYKKPTFDKGFLIKVEYYTIMETSYNNVLKIREHNYYDKVLEVDVEYNFGDDRYISDRKTTRTWWTQDDKPSPFKKITTKKYTVSEGILEGKRRRTNIIDHTQFDVVGLILQTELAKLQMGGTPLATNADEAEELGLPFIRSNANAIVEFIEYGINLGSDGNSSILIDAVTNDNTHGWLDNQIQQGYTIRDYIVDRLNESIPQ